ncbi:GDSL-type esterase/lipase family protein [Prescottella equi]|uniref:GDSL-type esterase/lipase family protein n=1 Tax=Rhodococcus hoagii TaxID=43767 RepID=UPI003397CE93
MHSRSQWTTTRLSEDFVAGALELERTDHGLLPHRLPRQARSQCTDGQLAMAESQPSGVRVVFRTCATVVELDTLRTRRVYLGAPPRPAGMYDLLVDGHLVAQAGGSGGIIVSIDLSTGKTSRESGPVGTVRFTDLPAGMKRVEIWLPHDETTELVSLRTNAPIEPASGEGRRVWVHHGSSISQGSNAASPSSTRPALAAALGGVDLVNLGFGGSALLDPFTARALRDTRADLISIKIGINLVNADLMRMRAFGPALHGFLDIIRDGHPDTPLMVVSPIFCPIHEDTPGPGAFDTDALRNGHLQFVATGNPADRAAGKLTLRAIRAELEDIVTKRAAEDQHLHYLDGSELYGEADYAELPLPDRLHPDAATHRLIGERFAKKTFTNNGAFAHTA